MGNPGLHTDRAGPVSQSGRISNADPHSSWKVEVIRSEGEFDALEPEWNALVAEAPVSAFQTFEWLRTWWKYFGNGFDLYTVVIRNRQEIAGIAPMFIHRRTILGIPLVRHLQFIGRGISDYLEPILRPGFEDEVLDRFAQHLVSSTGAWDIFDLEDVNESSVSFRLLPAKLGSCGLKIFEYQGNVCPQVTLPEDPENLIDTLGKTSGHNFRRKFRKMVNKHAAEVEIFRHPEDDLQAGIEAFADLHGKRWTSQGYPNAFDDDVHRAFHVDIATKFAARGWLRLFFLRVDDRRVAVSFSFNFKKRIHMYQSNAYAREDVMRLSPGFMLRTIAMVEGIREGMSVFDFLRGNEQYKYREWNAADSKNWLLRAVPVSPGVWVRFKIFVTGELLKKSVDRVKREYYELRRYRITNDPSPELVLEYVFGRLQVLIRLGVDFIQRYSRTGDTSAD